MSLSGEQDTKKPKSLVHCKRPDSPEPSCVSMKSNESMERGITFKKEQCSSELSLIQSKRPDSAEPSCVSMKSDESMERGITFKEGEFLPKLSLVQGKRPDSPDPSCVSIKSDESMERGITFKQGESSPEPCTQKERAKIMKHWESIFQEMEHKIISLVKTELKRFKKLLSPEFPTFIETEKEDEENQNSIRESALKITLHVLRKMNQTDLANTLQIKLAPACHQKLKSTFKEKFQKINEGISYYGGSTLLNEIYTELYITEGGSGEVNNEHEVRQIETASRRLATQERPINCNDLFKDTAVRTVLTKGVAGIGKTVSVQKFLLDWAERKANQDILFIFPLPFRELNLMKKERFSLVDLLYRFFTDTKELTVRDYYRYKIMFIFDGLDECRLPLDFQNNESLFDIKQSTSVDVLLTNLIKGNLLPSALLWITSRPAACGQIPPECVNQVTEVRGFSDPQKVEYFRKRIDNQRLAKKIIAHMKSSRSLYIMCHIPVFCWISATVLVRVFDDAKSGEIPKTLTQMFTHFLIFQIKHGNQKYHGKSDADPDQTRNIVFTLGKLAFQQLEKGNLIFYEEDLKECGVSEVSVYSGLYTQIFREELGLHLGKVFSFVHLSVHEFLAALFAFVSFISENRNVLDQQTGTSRLSHESTMTDFLNYAVDRALQSENGHLDLFLRFLLGLSLKSNQKQLRGLLPQTESSSYKNGTVDFIKKKIKENPSPEKSINLFHCLNELNDLSLVQEVQRYVNRGRNGRLCEAKLSPTQWSALVFVLMNSEAELDEFNLRKYDPSEECLRKLFPVVKTSRSANLQRCNLTEESCAVLAVALRSNSSGLRELDLRGNKLQDSGVKLLSAALQNSHCKLETLRLCACNLTEKSCAALASVVSSNSSNLRQLDLSNNKLQDSGVNLLSAGLENLQCKLEKLRLCDCNLIEESCAVLASALNSSSSNLRELDLSNNKLRDLGVKKFSAGLENPHCKLKKLRLCWCNLTHKSCAVLVSILTSNYSSLSELDLSNNDLQDPGVKILSAALENPDCKLEILRQCDCNFTEEGCAALAPALSSENSSLRELDLSDNELQNSGVKLLSTGLENSHCKLETLRLSACSITEEGCTTLASALKLNPSCLIELNLNYSEPGEAGVELLSDLLKDPHCKLEKLQLECCSITEKGFVALASALKSNPSYLKELNLDYNKPGESGVKLLFELLEDPLCKLRKLK
ncbi:NACHT, LRR and PYD domains-containing protein 3-like [Colossoma macropomum]|uniref:NACHT, LRR and PYD domains-containing protein 3-like n=1 Tax=Colossoma macropomum TaxID=42526 RepID=UPI0018655DFE|nr:NACHT, LRR and PYD domains-containing protein 3-like [Colossoma macropomum]